MNTCVWGPPAWRIIHGLSNVPPDTGSIVETFIHDLNLVLPCKYCRNSFTEFRAAMEDLNRLTLEEVVVNRHYPKWLYDIHNMVNNKLWRQQFTKARVLEIYHDNLVEAMITPWDVIEKRLVISTPYFSTEDVFTLLGIIALNATDVSRRQYFANFVHSLGRMMIITEINVDIGIALIDASKSMRTSRSRKGLMLCLLRLKHIEEVSSSMLNDAIRTYERAKAKACAHGVCH